MMDVAPGWTMDVTRGPDWLFVQLRAGETQWDGAEGLADSIWSLMQQHFTTRVIVELDELHFMPSVLMGELVRLYKRVESHSGMLRLSGLSPSNLEVLQRTRLDRCFPYYQTREDAVMGNRGSGHQ